MSAADRSPISPATVWLVARKELLEALRDRRTLFVALVLPVLLYPLMMLGLAPLVSLQKKKLAETRQPVAVTGEGRAAVLELVLAPPDGSEPVELEIVEPTDPGQALEDGELALWIQAAPDFAEAVESGRSGELVVHRDGSDDRSLAAFGKWRDALEVARERVLAERVDELGLDPAWSEPIRVVELKDVASAERRSAYLFGKLLSLILVVMTLSGAFYPAVDVVAGEKERGTMETLLVAPCGRAELVLGKFVAVLVVTVAAAVLNLASMGLTMGPLMRGMELGGQISLHVTPQVLLGILLLLVPLSALFSALALALSTMARSVKEAQHYLTPLFLFVMPLALVVTLPNVELTRVLAAVPVTNAVLFFRDLLLEKVDWVTTLIVLGSTIVTAGLALWACVLLFLEERTLFRGPEGTGALFPRPQPAARPGASAAVFLFAASLAAFYYAHGAVPQDDLVLSVLITQFAIVLAPCLLFAWWLRVRPTTTFRLAPPRLRHLLLAVPIGLCAPIVLGAAYHFLFGEPEPSGALEALNEKLMAFVRERPLASLALLAALPAVCEELVYRGFLLSGFERAFSGRSGAVRAVLVSSVFFALFHLMPERWPTTFTLGLLFGFLALRSRSLWPGVIAHALNNGSAVMSERVSSLVPEDSWWATDAGQHTLVAGAVVVLVGSTALLFVLPPAPAREPDADASEEVDPSAPEQ